jgi:hypothetical protein
MCICEMGACVMSVGVGVGESEPACRPSMVSGKKSPSMISGKTRKREIGDDWVVEAR